MEEYLLEFVLHIQDASIKMIKESIAELGDDLEIVECQDTIAKGRNFRIRINTQDPALIFDTCAQFGRIKSVKVNQEEGGKNGKDTGCLLFPDGKYQEDGGSNR